MPICACESTVHLYGYRPGLRVTVSRVVLPGEIVFDVCPAIAKSCDVWPEFTITNATRPLWTVCLESTNEKSFAVTWTVVVAVAAGAAAPAKAANARSAAAGTTASLGFISTSFLKLGGRVAKARGGGTARVSGRRIGLARRLRPRPLRLPRRGRSRRIRHAGRASLPRRPDPIGRTVERAEEPRLIPRPG